MRNYSKKFCKPIFLHFLHARIACAGLWALWAGQGLSLCLAAFQSQQLSYQWPSLSFHPLYLSFSDPSATKVSNISNFGPTIMDTDLFGFNRSTITCVSHAQVRRIEGVLFFTIPMFVDDSTNSLSVCATLQLDSHCQMSLTPPPLPRALTILTTQDNNKEVGEWVTDPRAPVSHFFLLLPES